MRLGWAKMVRIFALIGIVAVAAVVGIGLMVASMVLTTRPIIIQATEFAESSFTRYAETWDPTVLEEISAPRLKATNPDYVGVSRLFANTFGEFDEVISMRCPNFQSSANTSEGSVFRAGCNGEATTDKGRISVRINVLRQRGAWSVELLNIDWADGGKLEPQDRPV